MNFLLGPGLDGLFTDENDHYSFGKQRTHENGLFTVRFQLENLQVVMEQETHHNKDSDIPEDPGNVFYVNCFQDIPDVKYPDRINLMIPGIFPRTLLHCCAGNQCKGGNDHWSTREIYNSEGSCTQVKPLGCKLCRNLVCSGRCLNSSDGICFRCELYFVCHNNKSCLQIQQESGEPNSMPGWLLKKKLAPMDPVTNKPLTENEFEEHNFACVLCLKLLCHMCVEDTELCYECRHQRGSKGGTIAKGKIKENSIICYNHCFVRQQEKTDIFVLLFGFMNER